MKYILILILFVSLSFSQVLKDAELFGDSGYDTLSNGTTIVMGNLVWFPTSAYIKGSMSIRGFTDRVSGTSDSTWYIYIQMFYDRNDTTDCSPLVLVDAIYATNDSTRHVIPVSSKSWWTRCKGYKPAIVPADTNNVTRYKFKALSD